MQGDVSNIGLGERMPAYMHRNELEGTVPTVLETTPMIGRTALHNEETKTETRPYNGMF